MNPLLFVGLGVVAGVFGGTFGIGGASITIPALVYLAGFSQHMAQGTLLAAMVPPIGLLAALRYWQAGNVNIKVALLICMGFFVGGYFGASIAHHISEPVLKKMFGILLFVVAMNMIFGK
jgi:uncharacterized membrane protein YfcA